VGAVGGLVGMIGGIALTALQGALVLGPTILWFAISNNIQPAMQTFADASASADWSIVRPMLAPSTSDALTDEQLARFWDLVEPTDTPDASAEAEFDFTLLVDTRKAMSGASGAAQGTQVNEAMYPVRYRWADGTGSLVYVFADADALQGESVLIVDLLVFTDDGKVITLLPDGTANAQAQAVGWEIAE